MMKHLLLILIITLPLVSSISSDIKEIYRPGETIITEISGVILEPILPEQIVLKRKNIQVPMEYDIQRIGDAYILYVNLPQNENNYTIFINDIITTVNGAQQKTTFTRNLTITGEIFPYTISPGLAIASDEARFTLTLNRDEQEAITLNFPEEQTLILKPGVNTITIRTKDTEPGIYSLNLASYTVPVLVRKTGSVVAPAHRGSFVIIPKAIEEVIVRKDTSYTFKILNIGEGPLTQIRPIFDNKIGLIEPQFIESLAPQETAEFVLTLSDQPFPIYQVMRFESQEFILDVPINISYNPNPAQEQNTTQEKFNYYCSELNGRPCAGNEICQTETVSTIDYSSCCLGQCEIPKKTSNAWIGYLLASILIVVIIIIILRYRKTKKQQNPLEKKIRA